MYFDEYIALLSDPSRTEKLSLLDLRVLTVNLYRLYSSHRYREAQAVIRQVTEHREYFEDEVGPNFVVIQYWNMLVSRAVNNYLEMNRSAQEVKSVLSASRPPGKFITIVSDEELEAIRSFAEETIALNRPAAAHVTEKIGRNQKVQVKYKDGRVVTKKYKQIENDLHQGRCVIIG